MATSTASRCQQVTDDQWARIEPLLPSNHGRKGRPFGLDNTTTIIMVGTSVALMYLVVAAVLFCIGLAVIDASYLESELQHPVTLVDYVELS